jgi:mono/diheme cytochrome c family protein
MTRRPIFAVFLIVFVGVVAGGFFLVRHGFSAREQPSAAETFIATRLRRLAIPMDARNAANPVSSSPEVLHEAMAHFADHCATCHANDGSGKTVIGKGLYPKPPDLRQAETQQLTDGELFYIIENGVRFTGMPAFGGSGNEHQEDSWELVRFMRHLPQIADDEIAQMKELNPKTSADLKEEEEMRQFLEGGEGVEHKHHH